MTGGRRTADTATAEVSHDLANGRRRADNACAVAGPYAVLAMQRAAGNAALSALMAARLRSPSEQAVIDIDAALREVRREEPAVDTLGGRLCVVRVLQVPGR